MRSEIAILATLLIALIVSLYTVAGIGSRASSMESDYQSRLSELDEITAQRDTLALLNSDLIPVAEGPVSGPANLCPSWSVSRFWCSHRT